MIRLRAERLLDTFRLAWIYHDGISLLDEKPQPEVLFVRAHASLNARLATIIILIQAAIPLCVRADWQDDWNEALNAARKEGKVAVITDVTAAIRDALTIPFQEKYGITVDLFGVLGREVPPRIAAERKAGRYLWDVL